MELLKISDSVPSVQLFECSTCMQSICKCSNVASNSVWQVEQEEKDDGHPGDDTIDEDAGPSSGAAPSSPAANGIAEGKPAVKQAAEKTPKQGQAEAGAAGEGRVQGNGKEGNLTELESRATGQYIYYIS